ncbi:MAG: hypothetical protein CM1200mP39_14050 [Dehalococcoidia bacterium]|nr:MAG: hypothetical protein CM1200mP39_14050 [Dehalococcoidia bacterium]
MTVYKGNPAEFGLPTTVGTILVQDKQTGVVVAVMDGGLLTGIRTGAASGVATRHLWDVRIPEWLELSVLELWRVGRLWRWLRRRN